MSHAKPFDHHTYTTDDGDVVKCNRPHIVCAANKYGELIIPSARHHDKVMNRVIAEFGGRKGLLDTHGDDEQQGFIDQYGTFWTREEALEIVTFTNQPVDLTRGYVKGKLFSENLY